MRLFQQAKDYTTSMLAKYAPLIYVGIKLYNNFRDSAVAYVSQIPLVKTAQENIHQVLHSASDAEDVREFMEGATQLVHYQLDKVAQNNLAKRRVLEHSLLINVKLAAKALAYFSVIRPTIYFFSDDYKIQTLDYMITLKLASEAAAVAVENIAHIAALNKICASESSLNLYKPCDDSTVVKNIRANGASLIYYLGNKATLALVSNVPLIGPPISRIGLMFVEGQALAEFRLTNQCTDHRYATLKLKTPFSFGAGAMVVGSAYLINQGIFAATGVNSKIIELAVSNITMLFNMLVIYQRTKPFPGNYPYSEVMYLPRRITALTMKESCNYMYDCFKQNHNIALDESEIIQENDIPRIEYTQASSSPAQINSHQLKSTKEQEEKLYSQLTDVISQLTKFLLGDRFVSLNSVMQLESFRMAINANEEEIKSALENVKWIQNSPVIKFSLDWLDYLPAFCFPTKLSPQGAQFIGQVFYANLAKHIVQKLDISFHAELVENKSTNTLVQIRLDLDKKSQNTTDIVLPFANNTTPLITEEPAENEHPRRISHQNRIAENKTAESIAMSLFSLFSRSVSGIKSPLMPAIDLPSTSAFKATNSSRGKRPG